MSWWNMDGERFFLVPPWLFHPKFFPLLLISIFHSISSTICDGRRMVVLKPKKADMPHSRITECITSGISEHLYPSKMSIQCGI